MLTWMGSADYLAELRSNRVTRPQGSRPLPSVGVPSRHGTLVRPPSLPLRRRSEMPEIHAPGAPTAGSAPKPVFHRRSQSALETVKGRALARAPDSTNVQNPSDPAHRLSGGIFVESAQRWIEREEARSLRAALEDMDLQDEARLHAAAQDEASELVWRHRNPDAPYRYSRPAHKYKEHLQRDSYPKAMGMMDGQNETTTAALRCAGDPSAFHCPQSPHRERASGGFSDRTSTGTMNPSRSLPSVSGPKVHALWDSPQKKAYMNLGQAAAKPRTRRSSGTKGRNVSDGSGGSLFKDPSDQIYEEPDEIDVGRPTDASASGRTAGRADPLQAKPRNAVPTAGSASLRALRMPSGGKGKDFAPYSSQRRSSQFHSSSYVTTKSRDHESLVSHRDESTGLPEVTMKDGLEVRSREIRDATSMRRKDRSSKLPTPAFVSDKPGRPIVSFDASWQAPAPKGNEWTSETRPRSRVEETPRPRSDRSHQSTHATADEPVPGPPSTHIDDSSAATIPTIDVNGSSPATVPTINVDDSSATAVPIIDVTSDATTQPQAAAPGDRSARSAAHGPRRPLPQPTKGSSRPLPSRTSTIGSNASLAGSRAAAGCDHCRFAISGRTLSAGGARFHPECFACFHCGEKLECVAFYPEPNVKRDERLGNIDPGSSGQSLRFYCHLDFHELFSPRCRSCKTPIEGEVVVACGGEWHVGHFFCAQCGDVSEHVYGVEVP